MFQQIEWRGEGKLMNVFRFVLKTATILLLVIPTQTQAREILVLSYQEMLAKSDLVVIANPITETTDTKEEAFLPGIWLQEKDGKQSRIESIGVETVFTVSAVLCAVAAVLAIVLLPGRRREPESIEGETVAMSFARCPGAPYCGHLARLAAWGHRLRVAVARSNT